MADPHRTESVPDERRGGYLSGPDLITAMRVRGVDIERVMLAGQSRFTLGSSPSCDLAIDRRYISHSHALLERRENRIRVTDLASKNGIVFRGRQERQFDIAPGDSFSIEDTTCYFLNDEMRLARPTMVEILGAERIELVDDLVTTAVLGSHVLIAAEPGCDQERLARAIWTASLRRRQRFETAPRNDDVHALNAALVDHMRNGTLLVRLHGLRKELEPGFVEALSQSGSNVRVILSAPSLQHAMDRVGAELAGRAHQVRIAPLRERGGELRSMIERWLIERGARYQLADFTDDAQAALVAYAWPGNIEELRDAVDLLIQLAPYPSERKAALEVNIPRSTVKRWLDTIGLSIPLLRAGASPST